MAGLAKVVSSRSQSFKKQGNPGSPITRHKDVPDTPSRPSRSHTAPTPIPSSPIEVASITRSATAPLPLPTPAPRSRAASIKASSSTSPATTTAVDGSSHPSGKSSASAPKAAPKQRTLPNTPKPSRIHSPSSAQEGVSASGSRDIDDSDNERTFYTPKTPVDDSLVTPRSQSRMAKGKGKAKDSDSVPPSTPLFNSPSKPKSSSLPPRKAFPLPPGLTTRVSVETPAGLKPYPTCLDFSSDSDSVEWDDDIPEIPLTESESESSDDDVLLSPLDSPHLHTRSFSVSESISMMAMKLSPSVGRSPVISSYSPPVTVDPRSPMNKASSIRVPRNVKCVIVIFLWKIVD